MKVGFLPLLPRMTFFGGLVRGAMLCVLVRGLNEFTPCGPVSEAPLVHVVDSYISEE